MNKIPLFELCQLLRYGTWVVAWESWEGKPFIGIFIEYYDGWFIVVHFWKFYLGIGWWCDDDNIDKLLIEKAINEAEGFLSFDELYNKIMEEE